MSAPPSGGGGHFVKNVQRRQWDLAEFEEKAAAKRREEAELEAEKEAKGRNQSRRQQQVVVRQPLQHRSVEMQLDSRVGKHHVVHASSGLAQQGGYYCNVCDCLLKDSSTYLDHINGKKHQRALGMTLRAERSTLGQVKAKLDEHKRTAADAAETSAGALERRLQRFQASVARETEDRAAEKAEAKQARKAAERRATEAEREVAEGMGQTTSDSRKRKQKTTNTATMMAGAEDEEEYGAPAASSAAASSSAAADASSRSTQPEGEAAEREPDAKKLKPESAAAPPAADGAEEEDAEQAMMRAMGFGGFASSKK